MMVLRSNGVNNKGSKAMFSGSAAEWAMSDSTLKNNILKFDLLFGEALGKVFETRWHIGLPSRVSQEQRKSCGH